MGEGHIDGEGEKHGDAGVRHSVGAGQGDGGGDGHSVDWCG